MAKTKLGNVKGPKGDQGVRGSKWYNTDKITGTSTSGTAFPQSGIADAMPGDMALNTTTLNLYICREGGAAASAKWAYLSCIKGPQGERGPKGEPTTVDASLSESSTNPVQNKIVASNFKDIRDSLSQTSGTIKLDHCSGELHWYKTCGVVQLTLLNAMADGAESDNFGRPIIARLPESLTPTGSVYAQQALIEFGNLKLESGAKHVYASMTYLTAH